MAAAMFTGPLTRENVGNTLFEVKFTSYIKCEWTKDDAISIKPTNDKIAKEN